MVMIRRSSCWLLSIYFDIEPSLVSWEAQMLHTSPLDITPDLTIYNLEIWVISPI